jgi:hypothetical protein
MTRPAAGAIPPGDEWPPAEEMPRPIIWVHCRGCGEWVDEARVTVLGISEMFDGSDLLEFECPDCGRRSESRRHAGAKPGL